MDIEQAQQNEVLNQIYGGEIYVHPHWADYLESDIASAHIRPMQGGIIVKKYPGQPAQQRSVAEWLNKLLN